MMDKHNINEVAREIPKESVFSNEASITKGLERLKNIIKSKDVSQDDLELLLFFLTLNPELFPRVEDINTFEFYDIYTELLTKLVLDATTDRQVDAIKTLGKSIRYELLQGWILLDKKEPRHRAINIFETLSSQETLRSLITGELIKSLICTNPLIPIDVRGEVAELFLKIVGEEIEYKLVQELVDFTNRYKPLTLKPLKEHALSGTDTIDIPFEIPKTSEERINLIWESSSIKTHERVYIDIMRILETLSHQSPKIKKAYNSNFSKYQDLTAQKDPYLSHPRAEKFIKERLTSSIRNVHDYIINPNQMIGSYTISDLTRVVSLCGESYWPDRKVRLAWTAFARSVLGFCKVANIGLGSKMVYITHGCDIASLVYIGQGTVVGKGTVLDLTGGIVIGARNYTGSFWSDTTLHGHLHIGDDQKGTGGTLSRLKIEPYVMLLEDDIAFPPGIGYLEAAYYASGAEKEGEIEGFYALKTRETSIK